MVIVHTFACDILLLLWTRCHVYFLTNRNTDLKNTSQSRHTMDEIIVRVFLTYRGLLVVTSVLSTFILRRHLMIWAVFAPKLVFEVCFFTFIVACIALVR